MVVKYIQKENNKYPIGIDWGNIDNFPCIDGIILDKKKDTIHYAVCETESDTTEKTIVCDNFVLIEGARIAVKFKFDNTAVNPLLKVGKTKSIPIKINNDQIIKKDIIYVFLYNGEQYEIINDIESIKEQLKKEKEARLILENQILDINEKILKIEEELKEKYNG